MDDVARRESAAAWELRAAWAGRWVVVLALDTNTAALPRLAGRIEHVSPTNARATLADVHGGIVDVPLRVVLSVRRPHFHEPADHDALRLDRLPPRDLATLDGQLALFDREPSLDTHD